MDGMALVSGRNPVTYVFHKIGLFLCNGTDGGTNCGPYTKSLNITTRVSFYTRQATMVAARSNYSIVSVGDLTVRIPRYLLVSDVVAS